MTDEHTCRDCSLEMLEANAMRQFSMHHVGAPNLQSMVSLFDWIRRRANPAPVIQFSNAFEQFADQEFADGQFRRLVQLVTRGVVCEPALIVQTAHAAPEVSPVTSLNTAPWALAASRHCYLSFCCFSQSRVDHITDLQSSRLAFRERLSPTPVLDGR